MAIRSQLAVACTLLVFLVAAVSATPPFAREEDEALAKNPRLTFLGQVGKKMFYLEPAHLSWDVADDCCKAAGLSLASIDSAPEEEFLSSAGLTVSVWTSGRDVGSREQFRWSKGKKIDKRVKFANFQRQTCLLFHFQTGLNDRLCSATWPSICEST